MTTFPFRNRFAISKFKPLVVLACLMLTTSLAWAGEADVVDAKIFRSGDGTFRFDVTLRHADTGWDHYANAFEIVDATGKILGKRILVHPHVEEQPFTRSLSNVEIPADLAEITVRGRDSVHQLGGIEMVLSVPTI